MSTLGWVVVAVLAWLALVGLILALVRGGAMADRVERERWARDVPSGPRVRVEQRRGQR